MDVALHLAFDPKMPLKRKVNQETCRIDAVYRVNMWADHHGIADLMKIPLDQLIDRFRGKKCPTPASNFPAYAGYDGVNDRKYE